jgi:Ca-activated chloride channel family protein
MNLEFAWPLLILLLPVPFLVAVMVPRARAQSVAALRIPFYGALYADLAESAVSPSRLRLWLAVLAWVLLVLSAARPQYVGEPVQLPVSGRDLMLAVDISGSMQTEDMMLGNQTSSRLMAVKAVAGQFIDRREGDRVGLILFGRQAYLQTPLTFDRETISDLLFEAAIGLAGKETAIGDAIGLAVKRLREEAEENRVLILLTDGANTAGRIDPLKAADLAAQEGIRIYTIGVGANDRVVRDFFGTRRVPSAELDEKTLLAIAGKTGGRYFRALDIKGLQEIYRLLDELEPAASADETFRPVAELYRWPLLAALLFSVLAALATSGLPRRTRLREVKNAG